MNRILLLKKTAVLAVVFAFISSCSLNVPDKPDVSLGGPSKLNFIDPDYMEMAAEVKQKHKDQDFYGLESEVRVEFFKVDFEERRKRINDDIDEYEDLLDLLDRVNMDPAAEKSFRKKIKKEITKLEKDRDSEHMLTPVGARVIHYNSVLALDDLNTFSDYVFYNNYERVKNIAVTYNEEANDWFRPSIYDGSMDGDGFFYKICNKIHIFRYINHLTVPFRIPNSPVKSFSQLSMTIFQNKHWKFFIFRHKFFQFIIFICRYCNIS